MAKKGTKRRKPSTGQLLGGVLITVRVPAALLAEVDAEIPKLAEERHGESTTRATVIRTLLRIGLKTRRGK